MKHLNKFFSFIAIVLCFSLCVSVISNAETTLKYKEINCGKPIDGLRNAMGGVDFIINSAGNLEINLQDYVISRAAEKAKKKKLSGKKYRRYAHITYNSKRKKKVDSMVDIHCKINDKYVYGNRAFGINKKKLVVMNKNGKIIKSIKLNVSKYLKKKDKYVVYRMAEVVAKNKVRLYYIHSYNFMSGYGGIIEVNTTTGKIKKIVSADDFVPLSYDKKNLYAIKEKNDKIIFYKKSIQTKKTNKFTTNIISYDEEKYPNSKLTYTFYDGEIMGVVPDGRVFYGTFDSKTFEQVGDISECKYFKEYVWRKVAMKSKNEFYLLYDTSLYKNEEGNSICGPLIVVKYQK